MYEYFSLSLTWDFMGAKISKRFPYKLQPKVFKFLLSFLTNYVWDFWNFEIEIWTIFFLNTRPNRSQKFKTLLLLQIAAKKFETFADLSSELSGKRVIVEQNEVKFGTYGY